MGKVPAVIPPEEEGFLLNWFPPSISSYGSDMDALMHLIYVIVGLWFLAAEILLLVLVVTSRRRPGQKAAYLPGATLKAASWILVPAALVLACDVAIDLAGARVWKLIKQEIPPADVTIRITAQQFAWYFRNAGPDGRLDTPDDVEKLSRLVVPVGATVVFELRSKDVIHSFWVPPLRLKQDAVPGRTIRGWFKAIQEGRYEITCAELCGMGHTNMRGWLEVLPLEQYQTWLSQQKPSPISG